MKHHISTCSMHKWSERELWHWFFNHMALGDVENENYVIYSPSCHNPSHTVWVKQLFFITKAVSTYCSLTFRNCMWRTNLGYRCNARKSGVRGGGRPSRAAGSVCVCVCVHVFLGFGHGSAAWSSYLPWPASVSGVSLFSSVSPLLLSALHS